MGDPLDPDLVPSLRFRPSIGLDLLRSGFSGSGCDGGGAGGSENRADESNLGALGRPLTSLDGLGSDVGAIAFSSFFSGESRDVNKLPA